MKKIFAVFLAISFIVVSVVACGCYNVSAIAAPGLEATYRAVREGQAKLLEAYCDGDITYEEYITNSNALTDTLYDATGSPLSAEAEKIGNMFKGISSKISTTFEEFGENANEYVNDYIGDYFDDYRQLADIESPNNPDMNGYVAVVVLDTTSINGDKYYYYSKNPGVIKTTSRQAYMFTTWDWYKSYDNGSLLSDTAKSATNYHFNMYDYDGELTGYQIYGQWVHEDGSEAETDDEFIQDEVLDFSDTSDVDLDKLLNDILEELQRQTPDFSTMEGLLESIYYRLGKLDSDNDNALLGDINAAILALSSSNDDNAAEIVSALCDVRDELKNFSSDMNNNFDDLANDFNKIVDFEVPTELFVINFDDLSDDVKEKLDDITELIATLLSKGVPMAAIQGGLTFYQDIIFNASDPKDITFDLTFNGEEYSFTILSTSFFSAEAAQALVIVKNFVIFVIGYAWVLSMRKKAVSMMN